MGHKDNREQVQLLIAEAEQAGCVVTYRRGAGHWKIITPSGQPIFMASTPSDFRGVKRTRSILRRHGVDLNA